MKSSKNEDRCPRAEAVQVAADTLTVRLRDDRILSVPLDWYPRLCDGTAPERNNWELIGDGIGIHWSDLDEDISVEHLLAGIGSSESRESLARWMSNRRAGHGVTLHEIATHQNAGATFKP